MKKIVFKRVFFRGWCWNGPCLVVPVILRCAKRMYLFTFSKCGRWQFCKKVRHSGSQDVIKYEGALKMDLASGAGMACAGPDFTTVQEMSRMPENSQGQQNVFEGSRT